METINSRWDSNHMSWRDMYKSASSLPRKLHSEEDDDDNTDDSAPRRTRSLNQEYLLQQTRSLFPLHQVRHVVYHSEEEGSVPKSRSFSSFRSAKPQKPWLASIPSSPTKHREEEDDEDCEFYHSNSGAEDNAEVSMAILKQNSISSKFADDKSLHVHDPGKQTNASYAKNLNAHDFVKQLNASNGKSYNSYAQSFHVHESTEQLKATKHTTPWSFNQDNFQIALYVAMAHGVLVLMILIIYGLCMILDDYRKPILWAILCSMPLREIQRALVEFWERPLRQGMIQTLWAIPAALIKAFICTLLDARIGIYYLHGLNSEKHWRELGFSTLMQWLVSLAFCTLGYEFFGPAPLVTAAFFGMLVYAAGTTLGLIAPLSDDPDVQASWSMISDKDIKLDHDGEQSSSLGSMVQFFQLINKRLTSGFVGSLHFVTAVLLISMMIVGSLTGLVFFSYKVGLEGKDAVVALKAQIQGTNYTELVGLKKWFDDNRVPDVIETYADRTYDSVSDQIDGFAAQYNLTEFVKAGREYALRLTKWKLPGENVSEFSFNVGHLSLLSDKFRNFKSKLRHYDFKGVYYELEQAGPLLLEHFHISKEDIVDKTRQLGKRWLGIGRHVFASGSTVLMGIIYLLISIGNSIATGAAEVVRFLMQAIVFFSVLYYLIISESGGFVKQVLSIVPLSETTRSRCATVLEDTVSKVLLSTVKVAVFQATFTWLLFRFFCIHFLYMSTLLALLSALLSLPFWFQASSLLGGVQLAMEGKYAQSLILMMVHIGVVRFAVSRIQKSPTHHLTGLSVAVGVVLFWHSPERAIMGPLIITVLIAVKNLYLEFVHDAGNQAG